MSDIGYVVIEYNQASGQPSIPDAADIHQDKADAEHMKGWHEQRNRHAGRRERYAIGTIYIEDDE